MEKVEKIINSGHFQGLEFSILTSVSNLTITCSFLIQFG